MGIESESSGAKAPAIRFETHPSRYKHWKLSFDGAIARLVMDVVEEAPMRPGYTPPSGESWEVFHERVDRAWVRVREAAAATTGNLAVVTHGLVCKSLAARCLALPDGASVPERWENTSVTIVEARNPWRVQLLNCCAHLEDLPAALAPGGIA